MPKKALQTAPVVPADTPKGTEVPLSKPPGLPKDGKPPVRPPPAKACQSELWPVLQLLGRAAWPVKRDATDFRPFVAGRALHTAVRKMG